MPRPDLLPISQPPPLAKRTRLPALAGGGTGYRLEGQPRGQRRVPVDLGWYAPDQARLLLPVDADRAPAAGLTVDGQLLGWADRDYRERYGGLRDVQLLLTRHQAPLTLGTPRPWPLVRAFAVAALVHDDRRWRRGGDVLVPWGVWHGVLEEVPAPPGDQPGLPLG